MHTSSSEAPAYNVSSDDAIIERALSILDKRIRTGPVMDSPQTVRAYLTLEAAKHEREVFSVLFLDVQNWTIEFREMFFGTLTQTSVYPRRSYRLRWS